MREHPNKPIFGRLVEKRILKIELNLLVDICAIERGLLRVVTHYLVADSIWRLTFYSLL